MVCMVAPGAEGEKYGKNSVRKKEIDISEKR